MEYINENFEEEKRFEMNKNEDYEELREMLNYIEKLKENLPKKCDSYTISFKKKVIESIDKMNDDNMKQELIRRIINKFQYQDKLFLIR